MLLLDILVKSIIKRATNRVEGSRNLQYLSKKTKLVTLRMKKPCFLKRVVNKKSSGNEDMTQSSFFLQRTQVQFLAAK